MGFRIGRSTLLLLNELWTEDLVANNDIQSSNVRQSLVPELSSCGGLEELRNSTGDVGLKRQIKLLCTPILVVMKQSTAPMENSRLWPWIQPEPVKIGILLGFAQDYAAK